MKTIRVVAAVIKAESENGEPIIFATQRGYGEFKGGWEFPGGKIEDGETPASMVRPGGRYFEQRKATVEVLRSKDKWFGVTYKEDKPFVMESIRKFKDAGVYPEKLWK